jgi:hypothetical protein
VAVDPLDEQPLRHPHRVQAAGDQPAEGRGRCGLGVDVEGQRVPLPAEVDDLLGREPPPAQRPRHADGQVFREPRRLLVRRPALGGVAVLGGSGDRHGLTLGGRASRAIGTRGPDRAPPQPKHEVDGDRDRPAGRDERMEVTARR